MAITSTRRPLARIASQSGDRPVHEVIRHLLRLPGRPVDLMGIVFQDLDPILNVGRAALRVVSHAHLLSGHHGADLRPQFLAGILRAPKGLL